MDNNKELNTPDNNAVPRAPTDVRAGEGDGNDSVKSLSEVVNQAWGTNFKDDASALKGLQENAVFRGKLGKYRPFIEQLENTRGGENEALKFMEDITKQPEQAPASQQPATAQQPSSDQFVSKEDYQKDLWFAEHADYKPHKTIVEALKKANPEKSYEEIVELPDFKSLFSAAKEAESFKNSRQPLTSSTRVYTEQPGQKDADAFAAAKKSRDFGSYLVESGRVEIPPGIEDLQKK